MDSTRGAREHAHTIGTRELLIAEAVPWRPRESTRPISQADPRGAYGYLWGANDRASSTTTWKFPRAR